MSLGELLRDGAKRWANRPAIADAGRSLSFVEADAEAARLAAALSGCGVRSGDRVGVHHLKSADGFLAMHAVVRVGAIAVPLDPASPPSRLAAICDLMNIDVIVSHEPLEKSVTAIHDLRPFRAMIGPTDAIGLTPLDPVEARFDDLAYIITTSGSTGEPKGIAHTQASAMAYAELAVSSFEVGPEDRVADMAPYHFDISTFAMWAAPLAGASLVVIPESYQRLPASLSARLADEAVTIWYGVPFLLRQLVARGDLANRDLDALRWVKCGGEVLPAETIVQFMEYAPGARFSNIYGPAEVNHCSHYNMSGPPDLDAPIPIGRPWAAAEFRVVDPDAGRPDAPVVAEGELWVAATTMMKEYFGQPELTRTKVFEVDGQRWYRTGDLVSDDGGELTFVGRVDHQVKVRGYRIEVEGVETELERIEGVEAVVVAVRRGDGGVDEIIAGVIGSTDDFAAEPFLATAREELPSYCTPTQIVTLNERLFTGSGKLDRRALRNRVLEIVEENDDQSE